MYYRADIDGLRALAVLAVVIFHVFPDFLPGGFVGVDIFFAISGYLITGILLKKSAEGQFSLLEFWSRRVKRLAPALLIVSITILGVGYFCLYPDEYASLGSQICALYLFHSNVNFYNMSGYWQPESEDLMLLHTWSLGVEEQFYIIYVVVMALLLRFLKVRHIGYIAGVGAIMSYAHCVALSMIDQDASFYLLHARFWEMLLGGGVAFVLHNGTLSNPLNKVASRMGATLVAISIAFIRPEWIFPGWIALLPVLGTCLLLISRPSGFLKGLLEQPVMVYVGKISYSLYLWHWIVICLYKRAIYPNEVSMPAAIAIIMVTFLLTILTYHLFENRVRFSKGHAASAMLSLGASCVLFYGMLVYSGVVVSVKKPKYFAGSEWDRESYDISNSWESSGVIEYGDVELFRGPRLIVTGSSHARMYSGLIHSLCDQKGVPVSFMCGSAASSPWIDAFHGDWYSSPQWTEQRKLELDALRKSYLGKWDKKVVVVADRYEGLMRVVGESAFEQGYRNFFKDILGDSTRVIVVGQPPLAGREKNIYKFVNKMGAYSELFEAAESRNLRCTSNELLRGVCEQLGERINFVPTEDVFISQSGSIVFAGSDGVLLYTDDDHLSVEGVELLRNRIDEAITAALKE